MTLGQFFDALSQNPAIVLFYFVALPLTALLAGIFGKGDGHLSPWKELYAALVYLACIPGIFAIILSVYLFLFERRSIMDTNLYTQILPIIVMFVTLFIIRKNVDFDDIPGFDKIGGLLMILTVLIAFMWILDKTHIISLVWMPFYYVILMFLVLLVVVRIGWKKMTK